MPETYLLVKLVSPPLDDVTACSDLTLHVMMTSVSPATTKIGGMVEEGECTSVSQLLK